MENYWFVDYLGYEEKQKEDNRLIVSFRSSSNKTGAIYLNKPITITTGFLNKESLEKVVNEYKNNKELSKYPLEIYKIKSSKNEFGVINITLPYNREFINENLSGKFQKGNYNKLIRLQYDVLNKKVSLDERIEKIFELKSELDNLEDNLNDLIRKYYENKDDRVTKSYETRLRNDLNKFFDWKNLKEADLTAIENSVFDKGKEYWIIRDFLENNPDKNIIETRIKIDEVEGKLKSLVKKIDPENEVFYNKEKANYELHFNSEKGFTYLDSRLSLEEFKQQVVGIVDIEKPLFKEKFEKNAIDRKKKVINFLSNINEKLDIVNHKLETIIKNREYYERKKLEYEKKNVKGERILNKLGKILNFDVDNIKGSLDQDRYDAAVSYVGLKFIFPSGETINEIHKTGNHRINESNNYKVYEYDDEYNLINGIVDSFKERKAYTLVGYNIPYDAVSLREASKRTHAKTFDIGLRGKLPRRTVVRDIYQRLLFYSQEVIDLYRLSVINHPYLRSSNPPGNHKLESMVNYHFPGTFHKSITYEELRKLEIKSINGDKESAQKIVDYLIGDVDSVKKLYDIPFYLESLFKIKETIPHVPITEIAFSPNSILELYKKENFNKNHNQLLFGYNEKIHEDEIQITKKRLSTFKNEMLKLHEINAGTKHGIFNNVYQLYIPLEEYVSEAISKKYPEFKPLFDSFSNYNDIQQFGLLQYAKSFLREHFADFLIYRKERRLFEEDKLGHNLKDKIDGLLSTVKNSVNQELLDKYIASYDNLKNLYRSFYVKQKGKLRRKIRIKDIVKPSKQLELNFGNPKECEDINKGYLFEKDNYDLIKLRNLKESDKFDKFSLRLLKQFKNTFNTLDETSKEIKSKLQVKDFDLNDLIYLYCLKDRVDSKKRRFFAKYGISADEKNSFGNLISNGYKNLKSELDFNNLSVILSKEDYLYITSNDNKEINKLNYAKIVRKIPEFNTKLKNKEEVLEEVLELEV